MVEQTSSREYFPDEEYRDVIGRKEYPELYTYEGEVEVARVEFALPKGVPVPFWPFVKTLEAKYWAHGRHLLFVELRKGPEEKGLLAFKKVPYKAVVVSHGSPGWPLAVALVVLAASVFGSVLVIAARVDTKDLGEFLRETGRSLPKFAEAIKKAAVWGAVATIVASVMGAFKGGT